LAWAGELCHSAKIDLAFHPHSSEFQPLDDRTPFEILMDLVDPAFLSVEIDVFWTSVAGYDPSKLIERLGNRCVALHLKDRAAYVRDGFDPLFVFHQQPNPFQPIGDGILDFSRIVHAGRTVGVTKWFVEQDILSEPLISSLRKSYEYLRPIMATDSALRST
jgi:sugar phosphate isomerase/epimerase